MTIEELLNLEFPAWQIIAKMDDEKLALYLKDITNLEPKPLPFSAQPCIGSEEKEKLEKKARKELNDLDVDPDPNNPIKSGKRKSKTKLSSEEMDKEAEKLMRELGL